jgi:hypothetical protein
VSWTWRLEDEHGAEVVGADASGPPTAPIAPTQSDAETWLGEHWRDLAEAGVAQVRLFEGETEVYGPMSLAEDTQA